MIDIAKLKRVLSALEKVAPQEPMNQDEMGGCVWCAGGIPGQRYSNAGSDPSHHEADCGWILAREAIELQRQIIDEIQKQPATPVWMLIETAPKDCLVDVLCAGKRYAGCHYDRICNEYRHITACGVLISLKSATHWMPVPAGATSVAQPESEQCRIMADECVSVTHEPVLSAGPITPEMMRPFSQEERTELQAVLKTHLRPAQQEPCCYGGIVHDCHAGPGCRIAERLKATKNQAASPPSQPKPLTVIDRSDAVNLARNMLESRDCKGITSYGVRVLCEAVMVMDAAISSSSVQAEKRPMKVGGLYNWKNQHERLVYLGENWSGNGYWHQFAKVESPAKVWCEVLTEDLHRIEETQSNQGG